VSEPYAREQAEALGIKVEKVDLTPVLSCLGIYEKKCAVIRELCPTFDPERDKTKMTLSGSLLEKGSLSVFSLTVEKPDGSSSSHRLRPEQLREIIACQNTKQRMRMMQLYYCAERLHYVVGGTTNRTELEQGLVVKYGDAGVDIEPIAHLYKTQVFQLSRHLGVVQHILDRAPSPDTWSAGVTDEEFFYRMPVETLDLLLFAWLGGHSAEEAAELAGITAEQASHAFRDFASKSKAGGHMKRMPASLL
jgi:NAD+ synthase